VGEQWLENSLIGDLTNNSFNPKQNKNKNFLENQNAIYSKMSK
jgi:hypothetical protein